MGNSLASSSNFVPDSWWFRPKPLRMLIQGLDASGKTTILYQLALGKVLTTIPTIGFNVETVQSGTTAIVAWDVGGRSKIRPLWRHYYPNTDCLIFVVDSNDRERLDQAKDELHILLEEEELQGIPLLVFCNKQDLPNALTPQEIIDHFRFDSARIAMDRPFMAIACSATNGTGLKEGISRLTQATLNFNSVPKNLSKTSACKPLDGPNASVVSIPKQSSWHSNVLGYDPSDVKTNTVLQNFRPIQTSTQCPFAKAAKLWGVVVGNNNLIAEALKEFVDRSDRGEPLDGFCIELSEQAARVDNPSEFGVYVYQALRALSDLDPSGERIMQVQYIHARGWRFRFAKADFFVTTFAPCYPSTSSRYTFGCAKAFVLLQPERSFLRHNLPDDTPETHVPPQTIRDKTRLAFRMAGRSYYIPTTTKYPPAEHIVKPIHDDGFTIIRWWQEGNHSNNETKSAD